MKSLVESINDSLNEGHLKVNNPATSFKSVEDALTWLEDTTPNEWRKAFVEIGDEEENNHKVTLYFDENDKLCIKPFLKNLDPIDISDKYEAVFSHPSSKQQREKFYKEVEEIILDIE